MLDKLKKLFYSHFDESEIKIQKNVDKSIKCYVKTEDKLLNVLIFLKKNGYNHLSDITAIDRIKDDKFELIYNIFSYEKKQRLFIIIKIDRKKSEFITIEDIWHQAQAYEQIIHEFFGIVFKGNPDLSGLILHNWLDLPPLRKDFDTEAYSRKAYIVDEMQTSCPEVNKVD